MELLSYGSAVEVLGPAQLRAWVQQQREAERLAPRPPGGQLGPE